MSSFAPNITDSSGAESAQLPQNKAPTKKDMIIGAIALTVVALLALGIIGGVITGFVFSCIYCPPAAWVIGGVAVSATVGAVIAFIRRATK